MQRKGCLARTYVLNEPRYVKCVVPRCLGYVREDVIDARGMCPESVWPADHYAYAAALAERSA